MREFGSIKDFVAFVPGLIAAADHAADHALERAAKIVEAEAKDVIGTYRYGWPPLKPETVARKANGDTPLLETGEMRDSIEHTLGHHEADVGSNNDKAVWHELGTSKIPARSFLAGAASHKEGEVHKLLGEQVFAALIGKKP